jgi:uroporphyrinogen decarboxylase
MTPKENLLRTVNFDDPEYIPYGLESVRTFWHRDAQFFFGNGDSDAVAWTDIWGVDWKRGDVNAPESFHPVNQPLKSMDDFDSFPFPDPNDPELFAAVHEEIINLNRDKNNNLLILSNPGCMFTRAWLLRGMENFLADMLLDPESAEKLLDKIFEYQEVIVNRELEYKPDFIYFGDDAGTNTSLMIRPELWRSMIKTRLGKLIKMCRDKGCYVIMHCCGHIGEIIDDIIEMGVNILNPVQASANDFELLKEKTRGKLVLYGGMDCDLLMRGTPDEVRANANRVMNILGDGGGYIANPDQSLPFPKENIDMLRETVELRKRL